MNHDDAGQKAVLTTAMAHSQEKALTIHLLMGADWLRFQPLLLGLKNDFTLGQDKYPSARVEVYNTLINTKTPHAAQGKCEDG